MNAGGVLNTCKSSEKVPSGISTAADELVTRENLPFSEEYSREIEVNAAYVLSETSERRKVASLLPLRDELAHY